MIDFKSSFERYLKDAGYQHIIINDIQFKKNRAALQSRQKDLKNKGKGNKPNAAPCLTDEEQNELFIKSQLGSNSPQAIINSLWLHNTIHFGLRGVDEH